MMIRLRRNDRRLRRMIISLRENKGRFSPRRKSLILKTSLDEFFHPNEVSFLLFFEQREKNYLLFCPKGKLSFRLWRIIILAKQDYHSREARLTLIIFYLYILNHSAIREVFEKSDLGVKCFEVFL